MPEEHKLPRDTLLTRLAVKDGDAMRIDEQAVRLQEEGKRPDPALGGWTPAESQDFATFMQSGDELWTWASPDWTWEALMGRGGYAIVRDGEPVRYWMTIMN
jgi:hypothetical protein